MLLRRIHLWLVLTVSVAALGGALGVGRPAGVLVGGVSGSPRWVSLSGSSEPQVGDVLMTLPPLVLRAGVAHATHTDHGALEVDGTPILSRVQAPEDLGGLTSPLWGVQAEEGMVAALVSSPAFDPRSTCLSAPVEALAQVPPETRYLRVTANSGFPLRRLAHLGQLRWLCVSVRQESLKEPSEALDLSGLEGLGHLSALQIHAPALQNVQALERLQGLRVLDLTGCRDFSDVGVLAGLTRLRVLRLDATGVEDLGPVLRLPALRELTADATPLRALPAMPMNSLRVLDVRLTPLGSAAAFSAVNPRTEVRHRWMEGLLRATAGADRLRVREGGTCHAESTKEPTLAEVGDPAEIASLLDGLPIANEVQTGAELRALATSSMGVGAPETGIETQLAGYQCMCCGGPTLEFYRGTRLLASIGIQHGEALRWAEGWRWDADLTQAGSEHLIAWLADRGAPGPRDEVRERQASDRDWRRKKERATRGLSPAARAAFDGSSEEFHAVLQREGLSVERQVRIDLQILGASMGGWGSWDSIDMKAALERFPLERLRSMVWQALSDPDPIVRRGAARAMVTQGSLATWKAPNLTALRSRVVDVMLEGRNPNVRAQGVAKLVEWPDVPARERLGRALRDPARSVRVEALRAVGARREQALAPVLQALADGRPPTVIPLPPEPGDDEASEPPTLEDQADEAAEARAALLLLKQ